MLNTISPDDQKHETLTHTFLLFYILYFTLEICCDIVQHFHELSTLKIL